MAARGRETIGTAAWDAWSVQRLDLSAPPGVAAGVDGDGDAGYGQDPPAVVGGAGGQGGEDRRPAHGQCDDQAYGEEAGGEADRAGGAFPAAGGHQPDAERGSGGCG